MKTIGVKELLIFAAVSMFVCFTEAVSGQILTVNGTYTGMINGEAINGTSTGTIGVSGMDPAMNDITINFSSFPASTHPYAMGASYITIVCGNAIAATPPAQNLFALSGGNYTMNRTFTWPSLPGDAVTATGTASLSGGVINYTMNLTGTYSGPVDLTGVASHEVDWNVIAGTGVHENGVATVLTPTGSFTTNIVTDFAFPATISQMQQGSYQLNQLSFVNNVYQCSWSGTMAPASNNVPTLSQWGLMILGMILLIIGSLYILRKRSLVPVRQQ